MRTDGKQWYILMLYMCLQYHTKLYVYYNIKGWYNLCGANKRCGYLTRRISLVDIFFIEINSIKKNSTEINDFIIFHNAYINCVIYFGIVYMYCIIYHTSLREFTFYLATDGTATPNTLSIFIFIYTTTLLSMMRLNDISFLTCCLASQSSPVFKSICRI